MSELMGIVNLIKPPGISSFKAVQRIKKILDVGKAGHTGTLDLLAAGVLPVCINRATRLIPFLPESRKEYVGEMTMGVATETLDAEGEVVERSDTWTQLTLQEIRGVFARFIGDQQQIPPMYSAIRHQGKRLYELAREGEVIERTPREITIYKLEPVEIQKPVLRFRVVCSPGTYVRSLVSDLGQELGVPAYLSFLIRTSSGPFQLDRGYTLEQLQRQSDIDPQQAVIAPSQPLTFPELKVAENAYRRAINGNILAPKDFLNWEQSLTPGDLISVFDKQHTFIGIHKLQQDSDEDLVCKPERIFFTGG